MKKMKKILILVGLLVASFQMYGQDLPSWVLGDTVTAAKKQAEVDSLNLLLDRDSIQQIEIDLNTAKVDTAVGDVELTNALALKADLVSPALTGTPTRNGEDVASTDDIKDSLDSRIGEGELGLALADSGVTGGYTAYYTNTVAMALKAPLDNPSFTTAASVTGTITATGNITGTTSVTLHTDPTATLTTAQCRNTAHFNSDADVIDFTLPGAAVGLVVIFYDIGGGVITIDPADGTDTIYLNGTALTAGYAIDSPGAVGNFIALMAIDATRWVTVGQSGTWIDGGAD